ncbi:MAG: phosphopyruvate hydratase [Nanoarchaeota archaeon]|nr:phosphopyruvate hydratase [Nanoarchaeota archaeon]
MKIKEVRARRIFNSNGGDAIEVEVESDVRTAKASIGAGTSVGKYEVNAYPENINSIINLVNNVFSKELRNLQIEKFGDLKKVEDYVNGHDTSENMNKIGGNVLVALELAILKACSNEPLYKILAKKKIKKMPIPLGNCLGGGKHSGGPDFQEYLILAETKKFDVAAEINREVFNAVKGELKKRDRNFIGGRGMEGGWNCSLNNLDALNVVRKAADKVGREYKIDVRVGLDVAGGSLWNGRKYEYKNFSRGNPKKNLNSEEQLEFIRKTIRSNNLIYVEDPFHDNDFDSFKELNKEACYICGDDLIATNPIRLNEALKKISAVIVKPNQIGSLLKVKEVINIAKDNKIVPIISHRSGETEDNSIAHLAVGWECPIIKTGIVGGERIAKLNELLRISEEI